MNWDTLIKANDLLWLYFYKANTRHLKNANSIIALIPFAPRAGGKKATLIC